MRLLCLGVAVLLLSGCTAVRYPEPVVDPHTAQVSRPVVAVLAPNIRLDAGQPLADYELSTHDTDREIEQAAHVIHALRETGLFAEVDFTCSLHALPDVAVEIEPAPPNTGSFERWWLWFITVGLVPVTETHQEGVYFRTSSGEPAFGFDWPVDHIVGWAALPVHLSPHWHFDQTQARFTDALAEALLARGRRLFDDANWLDAAEAGRLTKRCR